VRSSLSRLERVTPRTYRVRPACRAWLVAIVLAGCPLAVGCGSSSAARPMTSPAAGPVTASASGAANARTATPGRLRKILVIMEENHSIEQVFPDGMPYLWNLARRYGYASDWNDVGHPSLPNYLAIIGGSSFDMPADCAPSPGCTYPGPTVFGQALSRGETVRAYEESMSQPCSLDSGEGYDVNHNPWVYFPSERASCKSHDVPAGTPVAGALVSDIRNGSLPAVGMITPNLLHDGHNGTLAQADAWLQEWIPMLMSGSDWRTGRLGIVVVFDEGETTEQVPFVMIAQGISGVKMSVPVNHYALTQLLDRFIGAPSLRHANMAADVGSLLGLAR
jgi:phospholipase C